MSPPARRRLSVGIWVVLALVLAGALAWGASRPGPTTPAERAAALDAVLRCPSCDGISVADSSASTAEAIRALVLARVREGESDAAIESYLVGRYGPSILLRPPATGVTVVVWLIPLLAAAAGAGGLAFFFWRRRRPPAAPAVSDDDRALVDRALAARSAGADGGRPALGRSAP